MVLPLTKADIRKRVLAQRLALNSAQRVLFAHKAAILGLESAAPFKGQTIALYWPARSEADPRGLIDALDQAGHFLALPVTQSRADPILFRRWKPGDRLEMGGLGIMQPLAGSPECQPDILFVPLAAFDRRGARIGYGAGHYDRALAKLRAQKQILAIGLAFAMQEVPEVPAEPHDHRLDLVLTERELITCRE